MPWWPRRTTRWTPRSRPATSPRRRRPSGRPTSKRASRRTSTVSGPTVPHRMPSPTRPPEPHAGAALEDAPPPGRPRRDSAGQLGHVGDDEPDEGADDDAGQGQVVPAVAVLGAPEPAD